MNRCPWDLGHTWVILGSYSSSNSWNLTSWQGKEKTRVLEPYVVYLLPPCHAYYFSNFGIDSLQFTIYFNPTLLSELLTGRIGSSFHETCEFLGFHRSLVDHFVVGNYCIGFLVESRDLRTQGAQVRQGMLGIFPKTSKNWFQSSRVGYTIGTVRFR